MLVLNHVFIVIIYVFLMVYFKSHHLLIIARFRTLVFHTTSQFINKAQIFPSTVSHDRKNVL